MGPQPSYLTSPLAQVMVWFSKGVMRMAGMARVTLIAMLGHVRTQEGDLLLPMVKARSTHRALWTCSLDCQVRTRCLQWGVGTPRVSTRAFGFHLENQEKGLHVYSLSVFCTSALSSFFNSRSSCASACAGHIPLPGTAFAFFFPVQPAKARPQGCLLVECHLGFPAVHNGGRALRSSSLHGPVATS